MSLFGQYQLKFGFPLFRIGHPYKTAMSLQNRSELLLTAFNQHPKKIRNKLPKPPSLPETVWINDPKKQLN
jgi:hypothetical protein